MSIDLIVTGYAICFEVVHADDNRKPSGRKRKRGKMKEEEEEQQEHEEKQQ